MADKVYLRETSHKVYTNDDGWKVHQEAKGYYGIDMWIVSRHGTKHAVSSSLSDLLAGHNLVLTDRPQKLKDCFVLLQDPFANEILPVVYDNRQDAIQFVVDTYCDGNPVDIRSFNSKGRQIPSTDANIKFTRLWSFDIEDRNIILTRSDYNYRDDADGC